MNLRWSRRALADLDRSAARIAVDNPPAASEFAAATITQASRLMRFPLLGRPGPFGETRELVMHRNYIVTYRLRDEEIQVVQVWHVARDRPRGRKA
ncbi:MAG: type II toxin-antitoxin system RelE/ParE family toxin [Caldimonas sp.]